MSSMISLKALLRAARTLERLISSRVFHTSSMSSRLICSSCSTVQPDVRSVSSCRKPLMWLSGGMMGCGCDDEPDEPEMRAYWTSSVSRMTTLAALERNDLDAGGIWDDVGLDSSLVRGWIMSLFSACACEWIQGPSLDEVPWLGPDSPAMGCVSGSCDASAP